MELQAMGHPLLDGGGMVSLVAGIGVLGWLASCVAYGALVLAGEWGRWRRYRAGSVGRHTQFYVSAVAAIRERAS